MRIQFDVAEIKAMADARAAMIGPQMRFTGGGAIGQMVRVAQQQMQAAPGDDLAQAALALRESQAERRLRREITQAKLSPLTDALSGISLGAGLARGGGGAAGMLGHIGQFAQILSAVNPELLLAAAAIAGLTVAAVKAADTLRTLGQGALATGSTPGGIAFGQALSGAAGLSPGSFTGTIQALRQRLATDPMGMAAAGGLGVQGITPAGMGPVPNEAAIFRQLFQGMRKMAPEQLAQFGERVPEMAPFEGIAKYASDDQIARMDRLAESVGKLASPEGIRNAFDLSLAQGELNLEWQRLETVVGKMVLPALTGLVGGLAKFGQGVLDLGPLLEDIFSGNLIKLGKDIHDWGKDENNGKDAEMSETAREQMKSMKEWSNAATQHAGEMRLARSGLYGGGPRAQGAIPPGLRGHALEEALRQNAIRLGAF